MIKRVLVFGIVLFLGIFAQESWAAIADSTMVYKFDFGSGKGAKGYTKVSDRDIYRCDKEYGLICDSEIVSKSRSGKDKLTRDFITSDAPFLFMVKVPIGRYKLTVTFGDSKGESETTVKAESRRLMLENVKTEFGEVITKTFVVDVRSPRLDQSRQIWLKYRETSFLNWDNKLTIEFNGKRPCVSSIKIEPAGDLPAVLLIGDSTVTDQEYEPWAAWGQMVTRFFKPSIVVANYAQSGEGLKSFKQEGRLEKTLKELNPGDFVLIQFGTNDKVPGEFHVEPFTGYKEELKYYIDTIQAKGGKPILVTPINFRSFDEKAQIINKLGEYPEAMRQTSREENVPMIDLNAMSKKLFEAMGPQGTKNAFVVYPADTFPGQIKALSDGIHQNPYGAYELAKCIVQWIIDHDMELKEFIVADFPGFEPSKPDLFESFHVPYSPSIDINRPAGGE